MIFRSFYQKYQPNKDFYIKYWFYVVESVVWIGFLDKVAGVLV